MGAGSPFAQVMDRWNELPRARQLALAGIVAGTIIVFYFVFMSSSKPNMVVAYSGLAPEDTAAIVDELEKSGVPYELGGSGTTIAIPATKISEVSIKLAAAGLGKGGTLGFEIFDKTNFAATDKVQDINFQRALQGELARSINTLDGIRSSRVAIVLPKDALFKEDQQDTTAAVVLDLKPGAQLSQDQVRGITNLIVNSVPGLQMAGVSITDSHAKVLFDGKSFDGQFSAGASANQMQLQSQYETSLQRDIESTLERIVGPGKSAVTVRALLNFDSVTETSKEFASPENVVKRSSSTDTESFTGSGGSTTGVPGTGSNGAATVTPGSTGANSGDYKRETTTENNEIGETNKIIVKAPGSITKLSVSVVLDESVPAAQAADLSQAVAAAVSLDQTRGDTMSLIRIPFDTSVQDAFAAVPTGTGMETYLSYLKLLLPILAVVLGFVLVMLLLRSLGKRQMALPSPYMATALAGAGAGGYELDSPMREQLPAIQAGSDPAEERVMKLADSNPKAVADVVQTWMREEES
ncbi:hypothetical protein AYO38_05380 [bacterium SCGC AG-212-C10]|nr:hypothetical protein AYO38_05380 [bacterium SCGC AG-212-C10]